MTIVSEQVRRGARHRDYVSVGHVTNGVSYSLNVGANAHGPHQEMWWFTNTGALSTVGVHGYKGIITKPGAPAVVSVVDNPPGSQFEVFAANQSVCARLSAVVKDGVTLGRLEAISPAGSADLMLPVAAAATGIGLSTYQGTVHDITVVMTVMPEATTQLPPRNVPLLDGSLAYGKALGSGQHRDVEILLDPKYALIDLSYVTNGGSGFATRLALSANTEMSYALLSNEGTPTNIDRVSGRLNAGSAINLLGSTYYGLYGRVTFAQMANGGWQGWVRAHSAVEKFAEGVFIVNPSGGVAPRITLSTPSTANKFAYALRRYLK